MKLFTFFFYLLTTLSFANDESQRIANDLNSYVSNTSLSSKISPVDSDVAKIKEKIEKVQEKLLNLEVAVELGIEEFNFKEEVIAIDRELWKHETSLHSYSNETAGSKWNESELMLLEAKNKLDSLEEKIKLEGEWGDISLRYNPIKRIDPDLRYRFTF